MNIIMYTKTGCPWCRAAAELLHSKNVPFDEREVRNNEQFMKELVEKSGQNKVPTFDIDGHILADSDADQLAVYLKEKGVPGF